MLTTWMAYSLGLSVLVMIAAAVAGKAAASMRWPGRWIWIAALVAIVVLPVLLPVTASWLGPGSDAPVLWMAAAPGSGSASGAMSSSATFLEQAALELPFMERVLAAIWVLSSAFFFVHILFSALQLRRLKRTWSTTQVDGREVWITESGGPSLVGVFRPKVALPTWILDWREGDRDLVVRHEAEHASAGDPWLNVLGITALGLVPWNPLAWWGRRRLVQAIEVDCDARVLSSSVDPRSYAEVLLEVARWTVPVRLSPAALTATNSNLERRITMALEYHAPRRLAVGIALLALAGLLAIMPAATDAPDPPTMTYLGSLALQAQEVPPDLGWGMAGRLPYTPSSEQTAFALAMHHPRALSRGLPEDQTVWFVIDAEMRILHTGIGPADGLHERVRSLHPDNVTEYVVELSHETIDGLTLQTAWFVPEPPPLPGR